MKLPKLKFTFKIKPLLNYIFIIVVSSFFIATLFIALPFTEKILSKVSYNLNPKNYWSEEYSISVENTDPKAMDQTRSIIYKRLKGFGVEEISTYREGDKIRVAVTSSKDKELTKELISNKFEVKIVTRKSDVNFNDTENPYAYILETNYDTTEWTREDFRSVYLTKLRNSSGSYSYFAIFKLWPNKVESFDAFLQQYNGQYIGVSIDGFVTPHLVDTTSKSSIFAIPISTEDVSTIKVMSLLYNSGVVPTNYKIDSETELTPNMPQVDYVQLTIGIFAAIVIFYIYLLISKATSKDILLKSLLATSLTVAIYLTFLKVTQLPVDLFVLTIEAILVIILTRVLAENRDSLFSLEVLLLIVLITLIFLGNGYVSLIAQDMLVLTVLSKLCLLISGWYINKVKKI